MCIYVHSLSVLEEEEMAGMGFLDFAFHLKAEVTTGFSVFSCSFLIKGK